MRCSVALCFTVFMLIVTACARTPIPAPEPEDTTEVDVAAVEGALDERLEAWIAQT